MSATPELRIYGKTLGEVKENVIRIFEWCQNEDTQVMVIADQNLPSVLKTVKSIQMDLEKMPLEIYTANIITEAIAQQKTAFTLDSLPSDMWTKSVKPIQRKVRKKITNITPKKKKRK
jgi:hypothetical protein